jgi:endonuclease/exonuclease/phosphatase family metal-dependent hydrolase
LRKLIKYFFLILNITVAFTLLLGKAIPYISPSKFWLMGVLGLVTPYVALANVVFIFFWLFAAKWKRSLISLTVIILSWNVFSVGIGGNFKAENHSEREQKNALKVLSYNVRLMDLYNWTGKKSTRSDMLEFFKKQQPDILCLQEFFSSSDNSGINNVQDIAKVCGFSYFSENKNFDTKRGFFGDIIFSKYPIQNADRVPLNEVRTKGFQFADILVQNKLVRIYNLHLQSVRFSESDKDAIGGKEISPNEKNIAQGKIIMEKLKVSYSKRGLQAEKVAQHISSSPLPVITCGDFNDLPSSYTYFKVRGAQNDVFLEKGFGLGSTFASLSPVLRIDHILYSKHNMEAVHYQLHKKNFSDHYALEAWFNLL